MPYITLRKCPQEIAIALRAARAARDLTQLQISRRTGISQTRICQIEKGYVIPTHLEHARLWGALTTE